MSFQDFQAGHHGSHLRYWNGTNLAVLNLHVAPMPPTMFGLNQTCRLGADMVWRFSRWPPWRPSWILEPSDFSNSESLCCSYAFHQVSALSDLHGLGDVVWRFSRWPIWLLSRIFEQNDFSNSKSPCSTNASHQVWAQSDLGFGSRCGLKIFKMAAQATILDMRKEQF